MSHTVTWSWRGRCPSVRNAGVRCDDWMANLPGARFVHDALAFADPLATAPQGTRRGPHRSANGAGQSDGRAPLAAARLAVNHDVGRRRWPIAARRGHAHDERLLNSSARRARLVMIRYNAGCVRRGGWLAEPLLGGRIGGHNTRTGRLAWRADTATEPHTGRDTNNRVHAGCVVTGGQT